MMKRSFKTLLYLAVFVFLAQFAFAYNVVKLSPEYFPNTSIGRALGTASIYVGTPDLDPTVVANQKTLSVQQEDGTIVAVTQPIYTSAGGVPTYLGSPVTLLVDGDYSLTVLDSNGSQVYYVPSVLYYTPLTTPYGRYLVDYTEVDQGAVGGGNSVYDIVTEVGAVTNTTLYFAHNSGTATTTYTFTTNETITNNFNIIVEKGVILDGAGTLEIDGPFEAGLYKVFGATITIDFGAGAVDEVYPQWWGALGNGIQDDTAYFNSAAESITAGVLRVPAGNYKLNTKTAYTSANDDSTLYGQIILNNDISMKGDGLSSKLYCTLDDTFYATVVVNGTNHSIIEGLYIVGTGTAYDTGYGGGIRIELSGKTIIKDNYITATRGNGINFVGNVTDNNGSSGVDHYCAYTHTTNNIIEDCNGDGIYHIFSKYATISDNILENVGYTDAIILEASDHSTVTGNVVLNPNKRGILINTGSNQVTVQGNTLYLLDAVTSYDAILLSSVRNCVVDSNAIVFDVASAPPTRGIVTDDGLYVWIDTYHTISNNNIRNAGASDEYPAIAIQTDYNLVTGNSIIGGTYGIGVDGGSYNAITANWIGSAGPNVLLEGFDGRDDPTYTTISGNHCTNGLKLMGVTDVTNVTANYIGSASSIEATTTNIAWIGNTPDTETVTVDGNISQHLGVCELDSSGGALTMNFLDGIYIGQTKLIVMTDATASSTVIISHHDDVAGNPVYVGNVPSGDGEIATFDAVDETWILMWTGTEWTTLRATCTFL